MNSGNYKKLKVYMNENSVLINGREYFKSRPSRKKSQFYFEGNNFETEEELLIAEMLKLMGIRYLHHVNFEFCLKIDAQNNGHKVIWCPDFILEQPFRWVGEVCNGSVILGIEVKRGYVKGKPMGRSIALLNDLNIPVLLVNRLDIMPYYQNGKKLPLKIIKNK